MSVEQQPLVLLVDDEEDLCTLMQMSLLRMGIRTHIAHRLQDAKKYLADHQYDACLTDLNLPDGNGLELLDWIGHLYPALPVAVLTAYGNMEIAIAALKAGAFDFVSKPINQKHLEQLLQKALNKPVDYFHNNPNDALEHKMLIGQSIPIQQMNTLTSEIIATDTLIAPRKLPEEGLELYLEKIEKEVLLNALNLTHWNRTLAAKKLGMSFRSLRYRLKKFGLDTEEDE
ncbi:MULTISPECIES: DNA-binding response regulator [unclassified Acinetobacter]|uniref:DNA-binding response regulator n=1 Tax=unclassified Acinetobacter TaxID=196816 RepID=UPI0015D3496D|nr:MULTISPECIES: DNA-binding response regulator [unclassified Acinetobacter]